MIRRHGHPALLGLFVVLALALLFVLVFTVAGGKLFTSKQRAVMHFGGSIYGLQVGAPVVFRGVRVGSVSSIGLKWDAEDHAVTIPVVVELETDPLRNVGGDLPAGDPRGTVQALVERGLRAQLSMQSLLTSQLYVDLDFRPGKVAKVEGGEQPYPEVPTVATAFQALRNQVETLDVKKLVDDVSAIAASAKTLIASPELARAMADLDDITGHLASLSKQLDRRAGPLLDRTEQTLSTARQALGSMGVAASSVNESARRVGTTFNPEGPLVSKLRTAADELARTGQALRETVGNDSPLNQDLQRALGDLATASRSLRELADTLNQQPESVLRGRR